MGLSSSLVPSCYYLVLCSAVLEMLHPYVYIINCFCDVASIAHPQFIPVDRANECMSDSWRYTCLRY